MCKSFHYSRYDINYVQTCRLSILRLVPLPRGLLLLDLDLGKCPLLDSAWLRRLWRLHWPSRTCRSSNIEFCTERYILHFVEIALRSTSAESRGYSRAQARMPRRAINLCLGQARWRLKQVSRVFYGGVRICGPPEAVFRTSFRTTPESETRWTRALRPRIPISTLICPQSHVWFQIYGIVKRQKAARAQAEK